MKHIGGQAVIEGVMMKSAKGWSVAVRAPKGDIRVKNVLLAERHRTLNIHVVRGAVALFEALVIGMKALEFSAATATEEEEKPISGFAMGATIAVSMLLGIGLFLLLPLYATKLVGLVMPAVDRSAALFNLVDGIARVLVFLIYVWGIGLWSEIRRVFEYHGAEHKVIHAFEAGEQLDAGNIMPKSPLHPRCGTSFLLIVMVLSIIVFSFIPQAWGLPAKFLSRIVLIPLIAGLGYEMLKLSDKLKHNPVMAALMAPGLALQGLTTREPDASQVEVAVRALTEVLAMENQTVEYQPENQINQEKKNGPA